MVNFSKHNNNGHVLVSFYNKGRRIRKTFKSDKLADDFIKEMRASFERDEAREVLGIAPKASESGPMLISEAIKHAIKFMELNTEDHANFVVNRHSFKYFYKWFYDNKVDYLHEIKLTHLQSIQHEWKMSGLKWSSVNRRFNTFKAFLNRCVDWGFLVESPAERLKSLSGSTPKKPHWTESEIKTVLENLPVAARVFFVALYNHGTRPKDLSKIKWPDVDLVKGTIAVSSRKGKNSELREHEIFLTRDQVFFYENLKAKVVDKSGYVFLNSSGGKVTTNWFGKQVRFARRQSGLREGLVAYALRGMLFSLMAEMDIAPSKLQRIAGHAKSETTMKYYIQHDVEGLRNVISMAEARRKIGGKKEQVS